MGWVGTRANQGLETAALIPAYNAERTVAAVVGATRRIVPKVLVVDDGSDDRTSSAAERAGSEVVRHPSNRGKGAAIHTGLRHLAEKGFARIVALDADGQHLPEEIPKLLAESDADPGALVLSVRDKRGQPIAALNLAANWVADWLAGLVAGRPFQDTQCGFRVYPTAATLALGARGERMEFDTEVLIAAWHSGMPVREVLTRVYYPPVAERESHYRPVEDTLRIAWVMVEAFWRRCMVSP